MWFRETKHLLLYFTCVSTGLAFPLMRCTGIFLQQALGQSQGGQNQMGGPMGSHSNQMPQGQMSQGQMTRPSGQMGGQMMGARPNMPGQMNSPQGQTNQTQPGQGSGQGIMYTPADYTSLFCATSLWW